MRLREGPLLNEAREAAIGAARWSAHSARCSADSAALFVTSSDIDINGSTLKAGRYAMWMIPDSTEWSIIFSSAQPVFHLRLPDKGDEVLRITTKSHEADHMETLGFYFPIVDGDSAVLNMHWGKTVVPIRIKAK